MGVASDIMMALSVSYVDRMASSDVTRASIVLSKFAEVWPSLKAEWAPSRGLNPMDLPDRIPDVWDGTTRPLIAAALPDDGGATMLELKRAIGTTQTASQLSRPARRYLEYIPMTSASRRFAQRVAEMGPGDLATGLDDMIAVVASGGVFTTPGTSRTGVFNPNVVQQFRVPSQTGALQRALQSAGRAPAGGEAGTESNPIELPGTTITASGGGIGIPTWGWIVGGLVITAGLGLFAWQKWGSA